MCFLEAGLSRDLAGGLRPTRGLPSDQPTEDPLALDPVDEEDLGFAERLVLRPVFTPPVRRWAARPMTVRLEAPRLRGRRRNGAGCPKGGGCSPNCGRSENRPPSPVFEGSAMAPMRREPSLSRREPPRCGDRRPRRLAFSVARWHVVSCWWWLAVAVEPGAPQEACSPLVKPAAGVLRTFVPTLTICATLVMR